MPTAQSAIMQTSVHEMRKPKAYSAKRYNANKARAKLELIFYPNMIRCFVVLAVCSFAVGLPPLRPPWFVQSFSGCSGGTSLLHGAAFKNTVFSIWRVAAACHMGSGTSVCPLRLALLCGGEVAARSPQVVLHQGRGPKTLQTNRRPTAQSAIMQTRLELN